MDKEWFESLGKDFYAAHGSGAADKSFSTVQAIAQKRRDHVADALQEALDGAVYARAARCGPAEMAFKAAARLLRER
jgi:hypothetical protein